MCKKDPDIVISVLYNSCSFILGRAVWAPVAQRALLILLLLLLATQLRKC